MATSVPNTNTFGLTDVTAVVGGSDLSSAFTNSKDTCFDSAYGSKTMNPKTLYGFRHYTAIAPSVSGITFPTYNSTYIDVTTTVADNGGAILLERGICFNLTGNPTVANSVVVQTNTIGDITTRITRPSYGQAYYFSAYARNAVGITYYSYNYPI